MIVKMLGRFASWFSPFLASRGLLIRAKAALLERKVSAMCCSSVQQSVLI